MTGVVKMELTLAYTQTLLNRVSTTKQFSKDSLWQQF